MKRLTEEYFVIKKQTETNQFSLKNYEKIKTVLNVASDDEIFSVLNKNSLENEFLKILIHKAKLVLRLNSRIPLNELELELDKRL